jgi:prevent-host-death family protein
MDITKDIRPLTEFKRDTVRFMSRLKETGRPSVLTVNGRPALVVMDAEVWQDVSDRFEYAQAVAGIRQGLDQAHDGQGIEASALFEKLAGAPDDR